MSGHSYASLDQPAAHLRFYSYAESSQRSAEGRGPLQNEARGAEAIAAAGAAGANCRS